MRTTMIAIGPLAVAGLASAEEKALFNGRDLTRWTHVGKGSVVGEYEPVRGRRPDVGYIIQNHHEPQTVLFKEVTVSR